VAVQDDLVLAGKQIVQIAALALMNCAFVASRGGDVGLLGKVATEPEGTRSGRALLPHPRAAVTPDVDERSPAYGVMEVNDTASEGAMVQEPEPRPNVVRQCALAAADKDGPEEEVALIN
jgi:hypothetical protein